MIFFGISLTQGDLDTNLTPPAGVTQQIADSHFGGSGEVGGTMCFKSAGASEGSSYSFSWTTASEYAAIALTYSDADTTIGGTGIASAFNPSGPPRNVTFPSATMSGSTGMVVVVGACRGDFSNGDQWTNSYTHRHSHSDGFSDAGIVAADKAHSGSDESTVYTFADQSNRAYTAMKMEVKSATATSHDFTGALAAQSATMTGSFSRSVDFSGALSAQSSTMTGTFTTPSAITEGDAQGKKQQTVRNETGTALTWEGDWHALFTIKSVAAGTFNERLLAWINQELGTSYTEINGAKHALAAANGAGDWASLETFNIT